MTSAEEAIASVRRKATLSCGYRVLARLGAGTTGQVYEVEHLRTGRRFAAKFLRDSLLSNPSAIARFQAEASSLAMVRSQYVVGIVDDCTQTPGAPFFVMERLFGADIRSILSSEGSLTVPRACALSMAAAAGLRAIHASGLVHADVKPANVFVCTDDLGFETCKLVDLGLAQSVVPFGAGTVRYMAPELLTGDRLGHPRSDLYALGAVLYECLAGRPAYVGDCAERTIFAIMHGRPRPFADHGVLVPPELESTVLRALAPDPAARFADPEHFIAALSAFAPPLGPTSERSGIGWPRTQFRFVRASSSGARRAVQS